jgi:SulP family sulfate permease
VLLGAGVLVLAAGLVFRVPFPVQPLKALTAVAVAQGLSPDVIHAAGLEIGVFLLLLSVGGVADLVARLFTRPVVRALQFGVGVLLVVAAIGLVVDPPEVFRGTPPSPWPVVLAVGSFIAVAWAARRGRYAVALGLLAVGLAASVAMAGASLAGPTLRWPELSLPPASAFAPALVLLVVPQLPLTVGNAVVAVSDLAREYLGPAARRVRPWRVCLMCGAGNVGAAVLGGMPMCHGAGGLTAHVRLGARTAGMNLVLGSTFVVFGLFFARDVPVILGLLPVWALAAFLVYAGLRHALLVVDLRGVSLWLAIGAGAAGAALGNLAITAGAALLVDHGLRWVRRPGQVGNGPRAPGSYSSSSNRPSKDTTTSPATHRGRLHPERKDV